jgi:hypothetical protein
MIYLIFQRLTYIVLWEPKIWINIKHICMYMYVFFFSFFKIHNLLHAIHFIFMKCFFFAIYNYFNTYFEEYLATLRSSLIRSCKFFCQVAMF